MGDEPLESFDDLANALAGMEPENPKSVDQVKDALEEEKGK